MGSVCCTARFQCRVADKSAAQCITCSKLCRQPLPDCMHHLLVEHSLTISCLKEAPDFKALSEVAALPQCFISCLQALTVQQLCTSSCTYFFQLVGWRGGSQESNSRCALCPKTACEHLPGGWAMPAQPFCATACSTEIWNCTCCSQATANQNL